MADSALTQAPRLVELIAWLSQRDSPQPISYRAASRHLGVSEETVQCDLELLIALSDEHKDWIASLRVALVADGFVVSSLGAFRRPVRFTGEEGLALLLGLGTSERGKKVAHKLATALGAAPNPQFVNAAYAVSAPSADVEQLLSLARQARDTRRKLEINYCGSAGEPARRLVHMHQIVEAEGRWYLVAWCEKALEFRTFRADRVLDARLLDRDFRPQVLFHPIEQPDELLHADEVVMARVAFSAHIARWIAERYPTGTRQRDGRYVVEFRVADVRWFVREVLQYGAEAEVLEPESLREAVREVVCGP